MADLGDTLGFSASLYDKPIDQGGVLVNATSVSLTVVKPDGNQDVLTPTNPPTITGQYTHNYATLITGPPGRYVGTWFFTLSTGDTTTYIETFDVGQALINIDEALAHLRAMDIIVRPNDLDQLQWLCFVATDAVERDLDRTLVKKTFIETHDGGSSYIRLDHTPIASVTTVVENGTTLTADDFLIDNPVLWRGGTQSALLWGWGRRNIVITYVAGENNPPLIARKVGLNAVQRMWQQSQQAPHPMIDELGESAVTMATGLLTPVELQAYNSLRQIAVR